MTSRSLPSWRSGPAREAITDFLAASEQIPPARRVAVFGNDGTLWCEKPLYAQEAFFLQTLEERAADVPALHARPEYAALLDRDAAAIAAFGLPGIALALADLFDGLDPAEFAERARRFMVTTAHPTLKTAGNSAGDREMLEWTTGAPGPTLALVVDHDDAEREFAYASVAATFEATEGIADVARRSGWTIASMRRDWAMVFPE